MIDGPVAEEQDSGAAEQALLDVLGRRQAFTAEIATRRTWRPSFAGGPVGAGGEPPLGLGRFHALLPILLGRAIFHPALGSFQRQEGDWTPAELFWWQRYSPVAAMLGRRRRRQRAAPRAGNAAD